MPKPVNSVDKLVGQNIRIFREATGISQTRLGEAIGVSLQQIQKYEKGANRVSASRLQQIADMLEVPVAKLFNSVGPDQESRADGAMITDLLVVPYAVDMLRAFANLPNDKVRRSLLALAASVTSGPKN
jgi:transcriptional regulator with XRE-family HTH domain